MVVACATARQRLNLSTGFSQIHSGIERREREEEKEGEGEREGEKSQREKGKCRRDWKKVVREKKRERE